MADAVIERMGLRVVKNTLEADWSSTSELEDVKGAIQIEILPTCLLQNDVLEMIARYMADEAVADRMDGSIVVEIWHCERKGDSIFFTAYSYRDRNAQPRRQQPLGFQSSPNDMQGFGR